ncbi:efflux RND transporter periplasmic adaptor subunit [Calditrichota bacterium]
MLELLKNVFPKDKKSLIILIAIIIFVFLIGLFTGGDSGSEAENNHGSDTALSETWTCSMHPQIQLPGPGQCPICAMDLIQINSENSESLGYRQIKLSETAQKLASIQVMPVERKFITTDIRMVGKIEFDESRIKYITSWFPGRIDRMFVDYTGMSVRKGDHLVELYSPELLSTQQELIQSIKSVESSESQMMQQNVIAIKERLRLWGLTENQINNIAKSGQVSNNITIYAPMSGIVIHKDGLQGMYVKTGTRIYTIADLTQVWVKLDAYESDVPWIRYGQEIEFETETYPGQKFNGKIAFIDPVLNETTRTVKVRVNVNNTHGKLKPGMFVRANVKSKIAAGGKVIDPSLAGKWISPMHPEIVKDKPGQCDVCGMDLVRAEELGYVNSKNMEKEASLVIPSSAPLITGKRAIVYIKVPGKEGVFEGREVVLGPRAGDNYIVLAGLKEGELVVVNGNFKIDSAIQILAKPSMMNPQGGASSTGHQHGDISATVLKQSTHSNKDEDNIKFENISEEFLGQLSGVYNEYFALQYQMSHDNLEGAKDQSSKLIENLNKVDMSLVKGDAHNIWMVRLKNIQSAGQQLNDSKEMKNARIAFENLSNELITTLKQFGSDGSENIYLYHCPMAFDNKGADWLQNKEGTENPYFGSEMFNCGTKETTLAKKL